MADLLVTRFWVENDGWTERCTLEIAAMLREGADIPPEIRASNIPAELREKLRVFFGFPGEG